VGTQKILEKVSAIVGATFFAVFIKLVKTTRHGVLV
jgi:preprotein translocase subunit SecG